jgi:multidrug resistance efflux pump
VARSPAEGMTSGNHENETPNLSPNASFQAIAPDDLLPPPQPGRSRRMARTGATVLCIPVAILAALVIWNSYVCAPWTRDGRLRVQVANIAPQISGQIIQVRVVDNQFVHKGDLLYVIDPFDYRVALATASSQVKQRAADLQVRHQQAQRRLHLTNLATTAEEQQVYAGQAADAKALFEVATQQQAQAEMNLARTEVRSPVNGFVTNLLMRVGDYAHTGVTNVSVVDTDSYWIDGYFEETKLAKLCVGDRVEAKLLGFPTPIIGRIDTVTRGISVSDATPSIQGLPNVNAVYTWVRLAERVPVRVHITQVPPGVPLIAGLTATVIDRGNEPSSDAPILSRAYSEVVESVRDVFEPSSPGPGCIQPTIGGEGVLTTFPTPILPMELSPDQINPGLAPGLNARPLAP